MSVYSGKCDVADHFCMIGPGDHTEEEINKEIARTDFYIYHKDKQHRLDIHSYKDLVPYFPYIVAVGCFNGEKGRQTIVFSSRSWVDHEEEDRLTWMLEDAKKEYRRCKRKKIPFDIDTCLSRMSTFNTDITDIKREVVKRVAEKGEKADVEGLHLPYYDKWDRAMLAQEMSKVGYSDFEISRWVYQGRDYNWRKEEK